MINLSDMFSLKIETIFFCTISVFLIFTLDSCQLFKSEDETNIREIDSKWKLWEEGTLLRGANIYQRRVYPELDGNDFMGTGTVGPLYIQEDFNRLSEMGSNYVNISHPGIFTENPPYILDSDVLGNLKKLVEMIGQADMFAVIAFRTGPGRSEFTFFWGEDGEWFDESYYNDHVWVNNDAQNAWVDMWKQTAYHFKDCPYLIGYDLMVEPNSNEIWLNLWNQEEFYDQYSNTLYDWNQLFPRIVSGIREVDVDIPILIGGMGYSAVDWLPYVVPVSDPKTLYTVHQYAPVVYTHQNPEGQYCYPGFFDTDWDGIPDQVNEDWLNALLGVIDNYKAQYGVRVACNEYGIMRWVCGAARFMDEQMECFEDLNMNYSLWVWEPQWPAWSQEVDAFNFRFGPDPLNTIDLNSSELMEVIQKYWNKNTCRPSNIEFNSE